MNAFQRFREKLNIGLYNSKDTVLSIFRWAHLVVALSMIVVLVYYYGFPQTVETKDFLMTLIKFSFSFYVVRYFVRLVYDYRPSHYVVENWLETLVILVIIAQGLALNLKEYSLISYFETLGFSNFAEISNILIQLFFVFYIFIDIFKKREFRQYFKIHPGLLFMISILSLTLLGTGMLMLPEMTQSEYELSFIDGFFVSISSVSTTGLSPVDIPTVLTIKGKVVLMVLIQLGALNTIAFFALYLLIAKFGIGVKQHSLIEDYLNSSSFIEPQRMFFKIVKWVIGIEFVGFLLTYVLLEPVDIFSSTPSRLFNALFHSISSFCNAGMSIVSDGMMNPILMNNYLLQLLTLVLFFMGGFGMIYLFDLFGVRSLRERMKYPWKTIRFDTKVTLYTSLGLVVLGALIFFLMENNRSMSDMSPFGKLTTTLFSGTTPRYAGFNVVDTASLSLPILVFYLFLMFIGASSGSSGGGIRVSTFAVLVSSVISTIKGTKRVELFKRTIENDTVLKAYSIFLFFVVGNLVGIFALLITEHHAIEMGSFGLIDIIFEHVSASCTVGLSTGITSSLTIPGKFIIIIAMFIGRVGTLTIAYLVSKQVAGQKYKYPEGHIMIG